MTVVALKILTFFKGDHRINLKQKVQKGFPEVQYLRGGWYCTIRGFLERIFTPLARKCQLVLLTT